MAFFIFFCFYCRKILYLCILNDNSADYIDNLYCFPIIREPVKNSNKNNNEKIMAKIKEQLECPICGKMMKLAVRDYEYHPDQRDYYIVGLIYHYVCELCLASFTTTESDTKSMKTWRRIPIEFEK